VAQAVFVDFMPAPQTLIPTLGNWGTKKSQNLFEFWEYSLACEAFHLQSEVYSGLEGFV
jgi:hypothetical protein